MDPLDELKNKERQLSGWISDYKERSEQLPAVQQSLDIVKYQVGVASNIPSGVPPTIRDDIIGAYSNSAPFWTSFVNSYPTRVVVTRAVSGLAIEAASSNVAYQAISAVTIGYTPEVTEWAREKTVDYQAIQMQQDRVGLVRAHIEKFLPSRLAEFDLSVATFSQTIAGSQQQSAWGIHARNLLEHVKGDMFVTAQKVLKKQKVKWTEFADALARGGVSSIEHSALIAEEATHKILHSALTDIAKNLLRVPEADLRDRYAEFHDHLFSVFTLVDEATFRKAA